MNDDDWLAGRFEDHRPRLRAVAYRLLGSLGDADDAVQEAWVRVSRAGADDVENLGGWLTTVVSRVSLNMLQSRLTRREEPLDTQLPDVIVSRDSRVDPEDEALLSDSVGVALQVVLETLAPAERLAFVLHDLFGVPFEDIAPIVGRSPVAARQLASRARRRVRGVEPEPGADPAKQRAIVDAFLAASRTGDFEALLAVLDPDVVVRADFGGPASRTVRGARTVAEQAASFGRLDPYPRRVLVNGAPGLLVAPGGRPFAVLAFTVRRDRIVEIDILGDQDRLRRLL
ncbi:sigma-70 family RNA polymerase sigma factor [Jiangella anatolica]|uniref:RNA polymerase subunit sigma-70 n=1 Tax=Jiangella anatolica TaxID=2670374 RepID=A0A2W2AYG7_9ACTN|nr:sigma-70 family RNA polymerase sigma factor [Jiangella anatolica]PZF80271.1 RNA polymerase subunit sigma-70 [Jiangella anatolica]